MPAPRRAGGTAPAISLGRCRSPHPRAIAVAPAPPGGIALDTITDEASFAALAGSWDRLVRAMPRPSPFLLHGWLLEWWRHSGRGAELAIHIAYRERRLVAALPLVVRRRGDTRVAEFVGAHESTLADLLLAAGEDERVAGYLVARLRASPIDAADVFGLPAGSRLARALGPELRLVERVEAPVLDLSGGWAAIYRSRTTAKTRSLHRRRRRQLAALGSVDVTLARTPAELEPALESAFALHALRWRARPDRSTFGTPLGARFHRAALRALARDDVPRILLLRLDGRPIAFHYYFVLSGRMYVHRLAFDPALARFSPGLIATLAALEAASAEGVTRVEFLGGAERYKLELADRLEPLHLGVGLSRTVRGRAYVLARLAAITLQLRLKRSAPLVRFYYDGLAPARRLAAWLRRGIQIPRAASQEA